KKAKPVLTPLPEVAVRVVKSPGVCWETADWRGFLPIHAFLAVAVNVVAVVVCLIGRNGVARPERRLCASTTGVLPFSLGRQPIGFLFFVPQLLDELLAILPRHLFDRQVLFALEVTWVVSHHGL